MCTVLNSLGDEISKTFGTDGGGGGGSQDGKVIKGADSVARAASTTAAPAMGARRRSNAGMGAGSLLTGPSGVAQGALTTGRATLLGQ